MYVTIASGIRVKQDMVHAPLGQYIICVQMSQMAQYLILPNSREVLNENLQRRMTGKLSVTQRNHCHGYGDSEAQFMIPQTSPEAISFCWLLCVLLLFDRTVSHHVKEAGHSPRYTM